MPFSALTIDRSDINAFEGQTFKDVNVTSGGSTLNISEFDDETLTKANEELETDILEKTTDFIRDDTYATNTALLDAIFDADDENLLKNLLVYKFLELWFMQDATHQESLAWQKFLFYKSKYQHYLHINIKRLCGKLSNPKNVNRYQLRSTYGL